MVAVPWSKHYHMQIKRDFVGRGISVHDSYLVKSLVAVFSSFILFQMFSQNLNQNISSHSKNKPICLSGLVWDAFVSAIYEHIQVDTIELTFTSSHHRHSVFLKLMWCCTDVYK